MPLIISTHKSEQKRNKQHNVGTSGRAMICTYLAVGKMFWW